MLILPNLDIVIMDRYLLILTGPVGVATFGKCSPIIRPRISYDGAFTNVTMLLLCCYHVVTMLLLCCYYGVTMLLLCCYYGVTMLLLCCYYVVTLLLPC